MKVGMKIEIFGHVYWGKQDRNSESERDSWEFTIESDPKINIEALCSMLTHSPQMFELLKRINSCYEVVYASDGSNAVHLIGEIESLIKKIEGEK